MGDVHQQAVTLMAIALLLAERGSYDAAAELAAAADRARTAAPLDVLEWVVTARVASRIAAARVRGEVLDLRAARALAASMI